MNTHLKQLWAAMKLPKNFKKSYKFFCLGLDIRVADAMNSYPFYTGFLTASFHLVGEKRLCNGKEPLVRSKHIVGIHILLQFLTPMWSI